MKTDDLIAAMVADGANRERPIGHTVVLALGIGLGLSLVLFLLTYGVRKDFLPAVETPRFLYKLAVTVALAVPAMFAAVRLARPDAKLDGWATALLAAPVLLAFGVIAELVAIPTEDWVPVAVGSNSVLCMLSIPLFAAAPLALILYGLSRGAPVEPGKAGAVAGLAAAGLGATLYGLHCFEDSPLFVAVWYSLGTAFVVAAGALLGRFLLRW